MDKIYIICFYDVFERDSFELMSGYGFFTDKEEAEKMAKHLNEMYALTRNQYYVEEIKKGKGV